MKLALVAVGIVLLSLAMVPVGYFAGPEEDAGPRAIGFGVLTLFFSVVAAFIAGFIITRRKPIYAALGVVAVLVVTAMAGVIAFFAGSEKEAIERAAAIGLLTFIVVGGFAFLIYYSIAMKRLDLPEEELEKDEVIWAKSAASMVHYKSGNPLKFWEAVGGRLFLTNQVLEFRSFPAELYVYKIIIPLREIRRARPCKLLGIIPGALRIERRDGSFELFTFGAAFDVSRGWAEAIMDFRDDLLEEAESESLQ